MVGRIMANDVKVNKTLPLAYYLGYVQYLRPCHVRIPKRCATNGRANAILNPKT